MKRTTRILKGLLVVMLFLVLWSVSAELGWINSKVLSSPSEIIEGIPQLIKYGNLLTDIGESVKRVLIGVAAGSIAGLIMAVIFGLFRELEEYLGVFIELFRPIPPIAWIPIAILWFGIGDAPAYFLVSLGSFFPVFTNTLKAIKSIEKVYLNIGKNLGASRLMVFWRILVPLILPDVITGLKVGMGVGWIIVITAEMVGVSHGLGYMIQLNRTLLQTPNVITGMIIIGLIGLILSFLLNIIEAVLVPWKKRVRDQYEER